VQVEELGMTSGKYALPVQQQVKFEVLLEKTYEHTLSIKGGFAGAGKWPWPRALKLVSKRSRLPVRASSVFRGGLPS